VTDTNNNNLVRYEFEQRPAAGDTMQVAPGVHWLRMPLPFVLGHINLWLLEDGDSWTIVDTGVAVEESEEIWAKTFRETMEGRPVNRIIVTHLHPDHVGSAGVLCEKTGADLWMTREEYLLCRILVADTGRLAPDAGKNFYIAAGFAADALHHYERMFGVFGKFVSPVPESYHRLRAGDAIEIGRYRWEVIVGQGHSPEHACLYCEKQNLLISGDQLLPTISSNVSVYPTEPLANPLDGWLTSLAEVKNQVHEDVLVLPAHGKPFRGAHGRLDTLIAEHQQGLEELEAFCSVPRRAIDAFPALFSREINDSNLIMATGEAIAHLNYLVKQGRISVESDDDGVNWYRRVCADQQPNPDGN
jgi:glyoxylase-like metal-dependent hydrolase (beta-lactamase superfamily II)